jgi:hypothetical protein
MIAVYRVSRKVNMNIQIDPGLVDCEEFFRFFTKGKLKSTHSWYYHGDMETGLVGKPHRVAIDDFRISSKEYTYDSVGVAAGKRFSSQNHRFTSHLEIKYRNTSNAEFEGGEYVVLNIHLTPMPGSNFDIKQCKARLEDCRLLFKDIVHGVSSINLTNALEVTLDNFEERGYSISTPSDRIEATEANAYQISYERYCNVRDKKPKARTLDLFQVITKKGAHNTSRKGASRPAKSPPGLGKPPPADRANSGGRCTGIGMPPEPLLRNISRTDHSTAIGGQPHAAQRSSSGGKGKAPSAPLRSSLDREATHTGVSRPALVVRDVSGSSVGKRAK